MSDKVAIIRSLPGYENHKYSAGCWIIHFVPAPWMDIDGAIIDDTHFDRDIERERNFREKLIQQRNTVHG